jgi:uncharacterized membrane protein YoaK (UPF0700 family)
MNWLHFTGMLIVGAIVGTAATEFAEFLRQRRGPVWLIVLWVLVGALLLLMPWVTEWPKDVFLGLVLGSVVGPIAWSTARRIRARRAPV